MAWLRLYDTLLDNPKIQKLPPSLFRGLINLWCVAKRSGGTLPEIADVAFALRLSEKEANSLISDLKARELLDEVLPGTFRPHDWDEHQYASDDATQRSRKHRSKQPRNVARNGQDEGGGGEGNDARNDDATLHATDQKQRQNRTEQTHPKPLASEGLSECDGVTPREAGTNPRANGAHPKRLTAYERKKAEDLEKIRELDRKLGLAPGGSA